MRIGRKAATDSQRVSNFRVFRTANRGQANIVDLGIGAPHAAARDADLELARQIVEVAVAHEKTVGLESQRGRIADFVGIHSGQRDSR